jgi:hypothetical protein
MHRPGVIASAPSYMLNIQPLITRLVDDILRAVRTATIEELRASLSAGAADAPTPARGKAVAPHRTPRPRRALGARPQHQPDAHESAAERLDRPEPPAAGEITDPERLLSAVTAVNAAVAPNEPALPDPQGEPPASAARPTERPQTALRAGESLARASGAGLVIRRAKRT